jgi:hypothetical protein
LRTEIEVKETEGTDRYPVWFMWRGIRYYVDSAEMSSYIPGLGFKVTCTLEGSRKKHILWLEGDKWYVDI